MRVEGYIGQVQTFNQPIIYLPFFKLLTSPLGVGYIGQVLFNNPIAIDAHRPKILKNTTLIDFFFNFFEKTTLIDYKRN